MSRRLSRITALLTTAAVAVGLMAATQVATAGAVTINYCDFADTPVTQMSADRANRAVHCLTNRARVAAGVPQLALNYTLVASAQPHANRSAQLRWWSFSDPQASHRDPYTGTMPAARIKAAGYCPGGNPLTNENTFSAAGQTTYPATPRGAVNWWLSDPPHRATLLNPDYRGEGIGVAVGFAFPGPTWNPAGTFVADFGRCQ